MKIIEKHIEYIYGESIQIRPIADVHLGHTLCDKEAFKAYLRANDKAWFVGLGDLLDSITVTDRRYTKAMDGTESEAIVDDQVNEAIDILKPYASRILGLGEGNHERVLVDRTNTNVTRRICEALNVPYIGYTWIIKLTMREDDGRGRSVLIYGNHGFGGSSRTIGGSLTSFSRVLQSYEADIFLFGHVHRLQVDRVERLGLAGTKLIAKPKHLAICGTFLHTVTSDNPIPSWSETKGFAPARIGGPEVTITPNKSWVDIRITT